MKLTPAELMELTDFIQTRKGDQKYKKLSRKVKNNRRTIFLSPRNGITHKVEFKMIPGGFIYIYHHYIPIQNKYVVALESIHYYK